MDNASSKMPTLGRPRGLVPPKTAAQRMREYRQRIEGDKDTLRRERDRKYRERHREEINQRKKESRQRKQSTRHILTKEERDALNNERKRRYRERHREEINQRRKENRQRQKYLQHISAGFNIGSVDQIQHNPEETLDELPGANCSNLNAAQDITQYSNTQYLEERPNIFFVDATERITQEAEETFIKSEAFESIKEEFPINTDLLQVDIKEEPTDDSSLSQTNEHQGSDYVAKTIDSVYIKQEYDDTDMKLNTNPRNDANLVHINGAIIKQMSHDDDLQTYHYQVKICTDAERHYNSAKPKPKTSAERMREYRARKKRAEQSENAKLKTTTGPVKELGDRKRQRLESNRSDLSARQDEQWITVKSEIQTDDNSFIESEVLNNVETVWLKTADEKLKKQVNTDLLQVNIKEELTYDSSLNQTNEYQDSDCAAETIDSLHVKQECGDIDMKFEHKFQ